LDRSMRIIEEIRGRNLPGVRDKREERDSQEKRDGWDALGMLNCRGWRNGQRSRCSEFQTQNFVRTCICKTHSPFSRAQINTGYASCEPASIRETLACNFLSSVQAVVASIPNHTQATSRELNRITRTPRSVACLSYSRARS
jgi:hypothetical protein